MKNKRILIILIVLVSLLIISSVSAQSIPGDLNGDGCVNFTEINIYVGQWLNGQVSLPNVSQAVNVWLQGCALSINVLSPQNGTYVPSGTVDINFSVENWQIGGLNQKHLHYYIDNDPIPYMFYNGNINEVLYNGEHTHFTHWNGPSAIQVFGLSSVQHIIRFVLADENHYELTNPEASFILHFNVQAPPSGLFSTQLVRSELGFPVSIAFAPDGRLFVNERFSGNIKILDQNFNLLPNNFYTVTGISTGGERGLLGLAIDPDFATNKYIYVYYSSNTGVNRVARIRETSTNIGGEFTIILNNIPQSSNHNGGNIHFGPDGKLYVTVGDADVPSLSQNTNSLAGKMLRINKDGSIPSDNPFGNVVYAYGLRNSFDFTFHVHTGHLWATENGPSDYDEINNIRRGLNYGWPNVSGMSNNPAFTNPLIASPIVAPTGITYLSHNNVYGSDFAENLFYTEWNTGRIRRIVLTGNHFDELGSLSTVYSGGVGGLVDITEGPDGYLYVTNHNSIYRVIMN